MLLLSLVLSSLIFLPGQEIRLEIIIFALLLYAIALGYSHRSAEVCEYTRMLIVPLPLSSSLTGRLDG